MDLLPAEFHRRFLSQQVRADGRSLLAYRQPCIGADILTNCCGSASVRCGNNYYLAGVRCEVGCVLGRQGVEVGKRRFVDSGHAISDAEAAKASARGSSGGYVFVTVEYPKLCGAEFADSGGPCVNVPMSVSGTITELLNSTAVFDSRQLFLDFSESDVTTPIERADIEELTSSPCEEQRQVPELLGQAFAWHLYIHVVCLEYDGNPLDSALLASVVALENTRLPSVVWDHNAKWWRQACEQSCLGEVAASQREGRRLFCPGRQIRLSNRPMNITFTQIMGEWWVVDPTREEESLGCSVSFCMVNDRWHIIRLGGMPVGTSVLTDLQSRAKVIAKGLQCQLNDTS
ncbi:3 exoribonuclease family domain 1 protein [Cystoisospora suis]|uniref:Ribosomal RNA-processing protein 43 n=1 Tax=Cystoisospora suis TaxID=483139 RepID=A0A2C6KEG4_9APIC|nr:3 exoribonuclease family domain 1 protein [Cystoisospora suis]